MAEPLSKLSSHSARVLLSGRGSEVFGCCLIRIVLIDFFFQPLRKALEKMGVPKATVQVLIPETMDNAYNYNIVNYLKKLKMQGKVEFDKYVFLLNSYLI